MGMVASSAITSGLGAEQRAATLMQVAGLGKRYGEQHALVDISFEVRAGEIHGLIGPNGAGKTTLLEAVAGLTPTDDGEIVWRGATLPPRQRREVIFYLPDGLRPWDGQHVERVLAFFGEVYRRPDDLIAEAVAMVGLAPVLRKQVLVLSKGYVRRLMLALALLTPHQLLLMDEPFDGFDLRQTREMMETLRQLALRGRTLILAIHQLPDAERVCNRFILLADGRICGSGTLDDLRARIKREAAGLEEVFLALT
jgi:ABC-2 type transport system ATP-binding protein